MVPTISNHYKAVQQIKLEKITHQEHWYWYSTIADLRYRTGTNVYLDTVTEH